MIAKLLGLGHGELIKLTVKNTVVVTTYLKRMQEVHRFQNSNKIICYGMLSIVSVA